MMSSVTHLMDAADAWAPALLDLGVRGGMILLVAAGATALLRDRSAAVRHLVWTLGLGALLVLPVLRGTLPALPLPALPDLGVQTIGTDPGSAGDGAADRDPDRLATPGPAPAATPGGDPTATPAAGATEFLGAGGSPEMAPAGPAARTDRVSGTTRSTPQAAPAAGSSVAPVHAAPDTPTRSGAFHLPLGPLVGLIWFVGAAAALGHLALGIFRAASLARAGRPVTEPRVLASAARARRALGLSGPVALVWSARAPVPMTWGLRAPVLILPTAARSWSGERLHQVLLHELAHVARHDYAWTLVAEVARAIHWMNPVAWIAAVRARVERERACDDRVLGAGARPSDYAENLLGVAAGLSAGWRPRASVLSMARPRDLSTRLESILAPDRVRSGVNRGSAVLAAVSTLALLLPLSAASATSPASSNASASMEEAEGAPVSAAVDAVATPDAPSVPRTDPTDPTPPDLDRRSAPVAASQQSCFDRESDRRHTSIDGDDRRTTIEWSADDCEVELEIRGEIEFSRDDSGIERMGPGARFELEEEFRGETRRLRVDAGPGGRPEYRYWENGDERPFDPDGRAWLQAVLPGVFRNTTLNAEARARRILDAGGVDALLAEIERMASDHVAAAYFGHLFAMADLGEAEVREVLGIARRRLDSDHYRAQVLTAVVDDHGLPPSIREAYLDATLDLESDHYKHQALRHLLDQPDLDTSTLDAVVRTAADIESDHYHSEILRAVIRNGRVGPQGRAAFLESLHDLESDHYTSEVVTTFLETARLGPSEIAGVLDLTREIESDHYRAEVLGRVARDYAVEGETLEAYLRSVRAMESDHYVSEVALHLLDGGDLSDARAMAVIRISEGMESDHFRARTLTALAERRTLSGELRDAFIRSARGIGSSHFRDRVLARLVEGG